MAKRESKKGQTTIYKTYCIKEYKQRLVESESG
jgi:hypothetical protein